MEKNELLRKYELVFIVDAKLTTEEKENVLKEVLEIINKGGGKVISSRVWIDRQKFPFSIKKSREGTYFIINMEGPSTLVAKIRTLLKISEKVLRFITIKVDSFVSAEVAK